MTEVMDGYENEKKTRISQSDLAWKIESGFPQVLRDRLFPGNLTYSVRGFAGWGSWTDTPYVMIRHASAGKSCRTAMSIVYVFSKDLEFCYMALMAPWERWSLEDIAVDVEVYRNRLGIEDLSTGLDTMDLRAGSQLAEQMEKACIICRKYRRDQLPKESVLFEDLKKAIAVYENSIRIKVFGDVKVKSKDTSFKRIYTKYRLGNPNVHSHCEAIYADSDDYTQQMVEGICKLTGCSGLISTSSSRRYDLNRPANPKNMDAVFEYRDTMHRIFEHMDILNSEDKVIQPFLHLAFHAIRNGDNHGSEIRVSYCEPAVFRTASWFSNQVRDKMKNHSIHGGSPVRVTLQYVDQTSKEFHRYGENGDRYNDNSKLYTFLMVEISEDLRSMSRESLVAAFGEIIREFSSEFAPSPIGKLA